MLQGPPRIDVCKMFDAISPTYDKINHILSLRLDQRWRKKMSSFLLSSPGLHLLDCATGTADQLLSLMDHYPQIEKAVGIDLSDQMLKIAKQKVLAKPYGPRVLLEKADVCSLPFFNGSFDCITISFGIRNVGDVPKALREMYRVLKPGGRLLILEFSLPKVTFIRKMHLLYLRHLLPLIGGWISKCPNAYVYLNQTIETFPHGKAFCNLLSQAGFHSAVAHPLTFGIATIYVGEKSGFYA